MFHLEFQSVECYNFAVCITVVNRVYIIYYLLYGLYRILGILQAVLLYVILNLLMVVMMKISSLSLLLILSNVQCVSWLSGILTYYHVVEPSFVRYVLAVSYCNLLLTLTHEDRTEGFYNEELMSSEAAKSIQLQYKCDTSWKLRLCIYAIPVIL